MACLPCGLYSKGWSGSGPGPGAELEAQHVGGWFKAHRYGRGWTRATVEGWLCIGGFVLLVGVLAAVCYARGEEPGWHWANSAPGRTAAAGSRLAESGPGA